MSETPLYLALRRLATGHSLSAPETQEAIAELLDGNAPEAAAGAFLTALRQKGETAQELLGAVGAIRERMIAFDGDRAGGDCLDTCGTGGDGADTVNVSTAAAIVVAACGTRVIKHGNRSASGRSGSSDALGQLGISIDVAPAILSRCLGELGITFLFAPKFHPGLGRLARVRSQLPFRTIFNLVGPLCNPASPTHQLVGVPDEDHARRMAEVLAQSPHLRRAIVVTGSDGLDEVTLAGPTRVQIVEAGRISEQVWTRADFGLGAVSAAELRVSGPEESARLLMRLFEGEPGPVRDVVLANAAAGLWTVAPCPLSQAVNRAAAAIDSGATKALLRRWSELTRGCLERSDARGITTVRAILTGFGQARSGHPRRHDHAPGCLAGGPGLRPAIASLSDRPVRHDSRRPLPAGRAFSRRDGRQLPALVPGHAFYDRLDRGNGSCGAIDRGRAN